jgi:hypothetical protein
VSRPGSILKPPVYDRKAAIALAIAGPSQESQDVRGMTNVSVEIESEFISPIFFWEDTMREDRQKTDITRRKVLIAVVTATPAFALMAGTATAKIQQAGVKYQNEPKDGKQCSDCNFFITPNSCKQVDGTISPTGYCLLWAKKPT